MSTLSQPSLFCKSRFLAAHLMSNKTDKMKSNLLYVSASLFMLSISFRFSETGINWMWEDKIQVPIFLISMSVFLTGVHMYNRRMDSGNF